MALSQRCPSVIYIYHSKLINDKNCKKNNNNKKGAKNRHLFFMLAK